MCAKNEKQVFCGLLGYPRCRINPNPRCFPCFYIGYLLLVELTVFSKALAINNSVQIPQLNCFPDPWCPCHNLLASESSSLIILFTWESSPVRRWPVSCTPSLSSIRLCRNHLTVSLGLILLSTMPKHFFLKRFSLKTELISSLSLQGTDHLVTILSISLFLKVTRPFFELPKSNQP